MDTPELQVISEPSLAGDNSGGRPLTQIAAVAATLFVATLAGAFIVGRRHE